MAIDALVAFAAGMVAFFSPCLLPVIPGYVTYVSGISIEEFGRHRLRIVVGGALFVLGFATTFSAIGATASLVGGFLAENREVISKIAGALPIFMGFSVMGVIRVPWMMQTRRVWVRPRKGIVGAFPLGMAFAFAWTPCVGPVLASVLTLAATQSAIGGAALLFVYSMGLGIPFMLVATLLSRAMGMLRWFHRHSHAIEMAGGVLLLLTGVAVMTGKLYSINAWLLRLLPFKPPI